MTDKLRTTAPLIITNSEGESTTASKLNAISNQVRSSTKVIEKAVGDLWNQSGDSMMVSYPLQIPNLARTVGETKFLNPCLYPVDEDFIYVDNVGTSSQYKNEFYLRFKPKNLTGFVVNDSGGGALVTRKDYKYEVDATGDYWVDSNTGKVFSFQEVSSTAEVQYSVDSSSWNIRDYTMPAVIPDPRQSDFTGCRISESGGNYYLHLPPRCPLSLDFDGGSFDGFSLPDRYPPSTDWSDNYDSAIGATNAKKLWQNPGSDALEDAYYRYSLPKEIKDQLASLSVGDTLPLGFLYIWDRGSGTIIADATFKKTANDWIFLIESSTIDFSSKASGSEAEAGYNDTSYSVIVCGSPISRTVWTLSNALMYHEHGNEGDFSSIMSHSKLDDLNPPIYDASAHPRYPSDVPAWSPSRWDSDDHVSLLSRAGSQGLSGGMNRDANDNAMLGDFLLASTSEVSDSFLNISADSNKIYFGSLASGPYMFFDQSSSAIVSEHQDTSQAGLIGRSVSGYGLSALSTSGDGLYAYSSTGRAIYAVVDSPGASGYAINVDASSGAGGLYAETSTGLTLYAKSANNYAIKAESTAGDAPPLYIVPQSSAPNAIGPDEGTIYVNSATHHIYCYLNGSWTQLD